MTGAAFCLFATPLGTAAIVWRGERVVGTLLPEVSVETVGRRFPGSTQGDPPPPIAAIIEAVGKLLEGKPADFGDLPLDLDRASAFERDVYAAARAIPPGTTVTYGEMAAALGAPGAARAVGAALGRNPFPILIPCHRILSAQGSGGFSAPGGVATKMKLLAIEKAGRGGELILFDDLPLAVAPRAAQAEAISD